MNIFQKKKPPRFPKKKIKERYGPKSRPIQKLSRNISLAEFLSSAEFLTLRITHLCLSSINRLEIVG